MSKKPWAAPPNKFRVSVIDIAEATGVTDVDFGWTVGDYRFLWVAKMVAWMQNQKLHGWGRFKTYIYDSKGKDVPWDKWTFKIWQPKTTVSKQS